MDRIKLFLVKYKKHILFLKYFFLSALFSYSCMFIAWAFCKIFSIYDYMGIYDTLFYQTGKYTPYWYIRYIGTFNFPYFFYMLVNCWHDVLNVVVHWTMCAFNIDIHHKQYIHSNTSLQNNWVLYQYNSTWSFYKDFPQQFNKVVFDKSGELKDIFKYICPYHLFQDKRLLEFLKIEDNLNTLLILGLLLFSMTTVSSLFLLSYLGMYGVFILNLISIIIFWFLVVFRIKYFFIEGSCCKFVFGKWFSIWGQTIIPFELYIDSISYSYMLLTLTIAVCVYVYVFSYFRYEPNVERLLLFINLFVISMIILVLSGNFFVLFLGWELIGLTSFFLINFWSTKISTLKAAFKAYVFNKFSDVSLFIAILMVYLLINDTNILVFNSQIHMYQNYTIQFLNYECSYLEVVSVFFLIAAFIKSAQFGMHIWLPDSMEAPAPASALIHSATLVSAGVFLILRLQTLFELTMYSYYLLAIVGSFTAFFGGVCAMYQSDIKKILAYSTISHCGFLMVTCITRNPELTIFYLYVHGFFKAAVFLCVGNIIRFSNNYQDFKKMGGYWKYLPFECICSLVCLLNLSGIPFTLGFYIKHVLISYLNNSMFCYNITISLVTCGALTGLIYSYRLYTYVFFDLKKGKKYTYVHTNRTDLKSEFYSNTSLASNIAICSLIILGYIICIYLYINIFSKYSISESFDITSLRNSTHFNLNWPLNIFLNFVSAFNWMVIQLIIILIFSYWRYVHKHSNNVLTLFSLIMFSIFFYISTIIVL